MNIFQVDYETRLQDWHDLKQRILRLDTKSKCIEVDAWWQKAPLLTHYLHIYDIYNWPSPWELLVENTYCTVARALGMCYTLHMSGIDDVKIVEATDSFGNDVVLVLVDNAKYVLNYWPDTVVNNCLQDFKVKKHIDIATLLKKI
jgi:hypothetical protein